jgi:ABC-type transport system involved in multi-copper enzyme maturation permease subunit
MRALVHAEVLKLRTRGMAWLVLATVGFVLLTVALSVPKADDHAAAVPLEDPRVLTVVVGGSFGVPLVVALLLGVLAFTQEFRYGTVTSTYLGEPRRARVLIAKWVSQGVAVALVTSATLVLAVILGLALIGTRDGEIAFSGQFWQTVVFAFLVMAAYSAIGVAVGVLVRNQVIAIVAVLVWMLVVEWLVVPSLPSVGRFLPLGAAQELLGQEASLGLDGELLSTPVAALLLLGYTSLAVVLAITLTPKRDVL